MHPILLEWGFLKIKAYGFALALAFLIGGLWATRRGRRFGFAEEQLNQLFLWVLGSALIGARLYYAFQHPEDFRGDWLGIFRLWEGGLTQHGGILGALLVGWLYIRSRGWSFRAVADLLAPALALGEAITRLGGCYLAGCCHGAPTDLPWGVCYPPGSAAHYLFGGVPVHPAPLYLALGNALLFLGLAWGQRREFGSGRVFALFLGASSLVRFLVDFTRYYAPGDQLRLFGLTLAHSQWLSLALIVAAIGVWATPPARPWSADPEA